MATDRLVQGAGREERALLIPKLWLRVYSPAGDKFQPDDALDSAARSTLDELTKLTEALQPLRVR